MSDSDDSKQEDPRFRIPRGSSDEEIDSDLASGPPSPRPDPPRTQHKPSRQSVASTAAALTAGLPSFKSPNTTTTPLPDDCDDDEITALPAPAALSNVTAAVTRRTLTHASARHVDPAPSSLPVAAAGVSSSEAVTHPDMINRILDTLRATTTTSTAQASKALPALQKKIDRLHGGKKTRLSVPLPAPTSARIERVAAYREVQSQLTDKWADTVIANKRADRLILPLDEPSSVHQSTSNLSTRTPARLKNAQKHEVEIARILSQAGVAKDGTVAKTEDKAMKAAAANGKISKDDVRKRQQELAHIRSMAFHYDRKMKRIKKIKSKKFHRVLKKEREKLAEANGELYPEDEEKAELEAERRRVEERVTLRHKNTSKWVRRQLQRGEAKRDANTKAAIEDQLRLHEQLKRRQSREVGNRSDSDGDMDSDADAGEDKEDKEELDNLEKEMRDGKPVGQKKGIMALRFMQAADDRKRKEALELLKEMKEGSGDEADESDEEKLVGRASFSGALHKNGVKGKHTEAADVDGDSERQETGLAEDDGDTSEVENLERRVKEEYNAAVEKGAIGNKTNGYFDMEGAADVIKETNEKKNTFSTRLNGRLTADDTNPGLLNIVVSKSGSVSKSRSNEVEVAKSEKRKGVAEDKATAHDAVEEDNPWLSGLVGVVAKSEKRKGVAEDKAATHDALEEDNPWLSGRVGVAKSGSKKEVEKRSDKGKQGMKKHAQAVEESEKETSQQLKRRRKEAKELAKRTETSKAEEKGSHNAMADATGDGDSAAAHNRVDKALTGTQRGDDEQADLSRMENVARAFAGAGGADFADFEAAKAVEVKESLPTAKALNAEVLPGWGQWDGAGIDKKGKKRRHESAFARAARERLESARRRAIESRSDRNMRSVILEQRRVDSATKLTMGNIPYPYQTREQWERELSRPLCREFVSSRAFKQDMQRRVQSKLGVALKPMQKRSGAIAGSKDKELFKRGNGTKDVMHLRKEKAEHRVKSRRNFML